MKTNHTPNWSIGDSIFHKENIIDQNGQKVDLTDKIIKAKIVKAVNAHDHLISALKTIIFGLTDDMDNNSNQLDHAGILGIAREALAKAQAQS